MQPAVCSMTVWCMCPVLKMWPCKICGKPFQHRLKRLQHRRVHSTHRPYLCHEGNCTKLFSTLTEYQIHRRRHRDDRRYNCHRCWVKFLTYRHLRYHRCSTTSLQCKTCYQRFLSLFALKTHQRIKHLAAQGFSRREKQKLSVKIKLRDKHLSCERDVATNHCTDGSPGKDGNKILLKIAAGRSTTIISPKKDKANKQQKKKSKKKQKKSDKEQRNGIILSIKNGSVNLPKTKKPDIVERVNGLAAFPSPVRQVSDLKLKIKTYPKIAVEQKDEIKTMSCEVSNVSSPQSRLVNAPPEALLQEGEKTPNRKQLEEITQISNTGESKVRNGIVIVKDKSGRLQAEQLKTSKLKKRDRDNVFDSLNDMHVGIWKVMPSPRVDASDVLKLRLSPQKPLRLDSGLDASFESASARYLDVALKTKLYNSGDDSDVFDAGSVLDKDSENGGQGVNDSGIEVLSSSTVRSNGNSVRSVILDESSPNYLNTEDSLLSLDSPMAEAVSKSEHMLCHKCGGVVLETNNNTHSPGRCRCHESNPNSPFQAPVSPLKTNMPLTDGSDKQYSDNKKKSASPGQKRELESEKSSSPSLTEESGKPDSPGLTEESTDLLNSIPAKTEGYKSDSDESDIMMISLTGDKDTSDDHGGKASSDESEEENKSLCLKIQLGSNPSASPVKKRSGSRSPRKVSPDKRSKQLSPKKEKIEREQKIENVTKNTSKPITEKLKEESKSGLNVIVIDEDYDDIVEEADLPLKDNKDGSEELFSLSRTTSHGFSSLSSSNNEVVDKSKCELAKQPSTKPVADSVKVNSEMLPAVKPVEHSFKNNLSAVEVIKMETVPEMCLKKSTALQGIESSITVCPVAHEKNSELVSQSKQTDPKVPKKCPKKKPLFKSMKSPLSKTQNSESAIESTENNAGSKQNVKSSASEQETVSRNKKPLFKTRTVSVDHDQSVKKTKKPLFKRTMSAVEDGKTSDTVVTCSTAKQSNTETCSDNMKVINTPDNDSNKITVSHTPSEKPVVNRDEKNGTPVESVEKSKVDGGLPMEGINISVADTKVATCLVAETEDSLQEVPKIIPETTPVSPPALHKAVATALNPFQQQFLSFLSNTKDEKTKKTKRPPKKAAKKSVEKENICSTNTDSVSDTTLPKAEKEKKKRKPSASASDEKKSDSFSWLNIFAQSGSEQSEAQKEVIPETKEEVTGFDEDLVAISQKMDTHDDDDSDFDGMFESKSLASIQRPRPRPKSKLRGPKSSRARRQSEARRQAESKNVSKRKREENSDSDNAGNSSGADTIDLYCCHKKHDPEYNPFMDSDDEDFMPAKPFKRRASIGRRTKRSQSIGSMSSDGDFRPSFDGRAGDRNETASQSSRSRRVRQGQKSCCPCCLGSFRDVDEDEDHLERRPSLPAYKLPRNYKQFVRSTVRLMQLQEKIHQLFISLFPSCLHLISKVKAGTEEFDVLIEDVLFGLESQDVQFEPEAIPEVTEGSIRDCSEKTGLLNEGAVVNQSLLNQGADRCSLNDQVEAPSAAVSEQNIADPPLKSCQTDLSNKKMLENVVSEEVKSGIHECSLPNSGQSAATQQNKCLTTVNSERKISALDGDADADSGRPVDQMVANYNISQDSCVPLTDGDSHLNPFKGSGYSEPTNSVHSMDHLDQDDFASAFDGDDQFGDMSADVPNHLQITIDLSAARVSVCREPKTCLQRLQSQLVRLVKHMLPELDLKNYFFRNINNLEFLIDLMIKSNGSDFHEKMECTTVPEHEEISSAFQADSVESLFKMDTLKKCDKEDPVIDLKHERLASEDLKSLAPVNVASNSGEEIPFEERIKSHREFLKRDVFEFEEVDTAAMIKQSESVLSNIESLSKIAKRTTRTKSRDSRLRKRTAEEKRTLFVQEKILNSQNSSIICHSNKKRPVSSSKSKSVEKNREKSVEKNREKSIEKSIENPKQRFLSELNLGDRHDKEEVTPDVAADTDTSSKVTSAGDAGDNEAPVSEDIVDIADAKQDLDHDDIDGESRRKSGDKNIFELMQPAPAAVENAT